MKKILKSSQALLLSILVFSGCSSIPEQPHQQFESADVKAMQFKFDYPSSFFGVVLNEHNISKQVSKNLNEWGYKISPQHEINNSHLISVEIGAQYRDSTPTGFSLSMGNSNPRDPDFQKANVLPLTCEISSKAHPQNSAEMTMELAADEYSNSKNNGAKLNELLIDDLSTICYNLLSELQIETHPPLDRDIHSAPGWIPSIRIEEVNPEQPSPAKDIKSDSSNDKKATSVISEDVKHPAAEVNKQQAIETESTSPIKDETLKTDTLINKKPRKRIIIHNQETPVILKFGHERK